ncbi:HU family DNA-binding protein [Anaplasma capra]|uniref:HU family DNA-binding protein n=1 Tax=Anaplasma capra TaxID=1562740 RepID=UPI0021D5B6E9|nr:HU family DNA-binding protein [Anaplasma capra]MCU7611895.1 HU family DNA-binding protein [Anaplasma capra]MCU7612754.1 HU family DNA-binding protein [Anaplasma capra]
MSLRSDLIQRVTRRNPSLGEAVVSQIVSIFFSSIIDYVSSGYRVELRGFGSFSARYYVLKDHSSNLRLPKASYRKVYFRPSEKLVKAVEGCST